MGGGEGTHTAMLAAVKHGRIYSVGVSIARGSCFLLRDMKGTRWDAETFGGGGERFGGGVVVGGQRGRGGRRGKSPNRHGTGTKHKWDGPARGVGGNRRGEGK